MYRSIVLLAFLSLLCSTNLPAQNNYQEITLPELMKKKKAGAEMVIIDVRTDGEYYDSSTNYKQGNIGRLKGIEHIPIQELQQNPEAIKSLEKYKDKDVYLICSHSYRSRAVSNLLLRNGFTHVTNVQGGMTEWFRRATELEPYKAEFYETKDVYKTISTADLATQLANKRDPILIGISNKPIYFYDTLTIEYYKYMPAFKNAINFSYADSLNLLQAVKGKSQPVILYNTVNSGAAELAEWLVNKGVPNVGLLVGNFNLFYEYIVNQQKTDQLTGYLKANSAIEFTTPELYCKKIQSNQQPLMIDLRHDTLFNKVNNGTKHNFKHLKNSLNFFADRGGDAFVKSYPDKNKTYALISQNGILGIQLADELTKRGYKIEWIMGGLQRWEWYMNNVETFQCGDELIK